METSRRTEVLQMIKKDANWLEKMTSSQLKILARLHTDLTEIEETNQFGRKRKVLRPEARNRYQLYKLLRSKRRCPKNRHGEEIIKTLKEI